MKKIILSALGFFGAAIMVAQPTIVSTSPMNRAPVLEEFTGINCQYCPDGHKRAQELKDLYSEAVLVNIHAGSFANANPDYRTSVGEAIDNLAGVTGYPSGSVNRESNISGAPTTGNFAMSRSYWTNAFSVIANESSPVNIAIEPSFDTQTNELSLLVEVYYTDSTDTEDFVNVFLLQSNVKGPQVAAATYYPEMQYPDGDYNHNHMLRSSLSGTWGWSIPTAGAGYFWDTTITYTLPNSFGPVQTNWEDMEIAALITDDQDYVYTGVSEWFIPQTQIWNLPITTSVTGSDDFCATSTAVSLEVDNDGNQTITAFDVNYSVNGGAVQTESFSGSLAPNASTTIDIQVSLQDGVNNIIFDKLANVMDDQGNELFNPTAGAFLSKAEGAKIVSVESGLEGMVQNDFEDGNAGDDPEDLYKVDAPGNWPIIVNENYATWIEYAVGGHGESDNSLWFALGYASVPAGATLSLVTDNYDFSNYEDAKMKLSYAFGQLQSGENTEFYIEISTDCGATWDEVYNESGDDLETAGVDQQYIIMPEDDEWKDLSIDLSAYAGDSAVMTRFRVVNDAGNGFFIDDINTSGTPVGVKEQSAVTVEMYPNPAVSELNFKGLNERTDVQIIDMQGRTVLNEVVVGNTLDVRSLNSGVYTVMIRNTNVDQMEKLTIVK